MRNCAEAKVVNARQKYSALNHHQNQKYHVIFLPLATGGGTQVNAEALARERQHGVVFDFNIVGVAGPYRLAHGSPLPLKCCVAQRLRGCTTVSTNCFGS